LDVDDSTTQLILSNWMVCVKEGVSTSDQQSVAKAAHDSMDHEALLRFT